jgi:hypothetical protein
MTALAVESLHAVTATPEPAVSPSAGDPLAGAAAAAECAATAPRRSCALDLSRARTYDAVLDVLKAYKLSGNFHSNLEAVLRDMGFSGMVTFTIESGRALAFRDCRHVVFTLNDGVPAAMLVEIAGSMKARIGFAAPWWGRLLDRSGRIGAA